MFQLGIVINRLQAEIVHLFFLSGQHLLSVTQLKEREISAQSMFCKDLFWRVLTLFLWFSHSISHNITVTYTNLQNNCEF